MIEVKDLRKIFKLILISGYLKKTKPLSLMLVADKGLGKTDLITSIDSKRILYRTDLTYMGLLVVLLVTVLANVFFDFIGDINTTVEGGNDTAACVDNSATIPCGTAPTWVPTILIVAVGIGLVVAVFVAFGLMKRK